jgi:hypothetical protein
MSVIGILIALGLLVWLAYRGCSILVLAPLCAPIAALLASWTQIFMSNAAGFVGTTARIRSWGDCHGRSRHRAAAVCAGRASPRHGRIGQLEAMTVTPRLEIKADRPTARIGPY